MANPKDRENRILEASEAKDSRYKGAGIHVDDRNRARCTPVFCEWVIDANTQRGGTTPFPYGLLLLTGDPEAVANLPNDLRNEAFLEVAPCDRPDRRALKLTWNAFGTEAEFGFTPMASLLSIEVLPNTALWLEAFPLTDTSGMPVMVIPLGSRIQTRPVQESAPARQDGTRVE